MARREYEGPQGAPTRAEVGDALALLRLAERDAELAPRALALAERVIRRATRASRADRIRRGVA